ncbi:hypothetical protein EHQ68_09230 [Leptospira congkakensis]|uniref:Lipoprotein n=1 Tax=Leptospira congkakensis TaxID=2484932 RepID=A0A4Z1AB32_9LEPT|nr:hypothetical protein [Leptospira congkakensis]TGL88807.1 hypothetical protein EHQ69_15300 [Leptospira congkakensis]TGL89393.1 hypothetical protein EHQ68_09230 [Leptospira congkakensis]TGL97361.1 hypothetical protein EHQ70_08725 [Leptospira congkakensis]
MKFSHWLFLFILTFSSCVTSYRDYPLIDTPSKFSNASKSKLYYHLEPFPILEFGGYTALKSFFRTNLKSKFSETEEISDPKTIPAKGVYCKVSTQWIPISAPSLIFGYISVATATILPAWSSKEGFDVTYSLYKDGQKIKDFNYSTRRSIFLWIFALPAIWVNLLTSSEEEVFKAMSYQFIEDAKPFINE